MPAETPPPLLAPFGGAPPPAPRWFEEAVAQAPERAFHHVRGARIETLTWGEAGAPVLVLLHGGAAHADWWSFIAPFFAQTHRVVAFSWSGMGGSDWREVYSLDTHVDEIMTIAGVAGGAEGARPVVVGHSFGGFPTLACAARHGEALAGVVVVDSPLLSPEQRARREVERRQAQPPHDTTVYDSLEAALLRFRLQPPQPCDNPYIADHIARRSLRQVRKDDGADGWTWKFDPHMWTSYQRGDTVANMEAASCPVAVVWGAKSVLYPPETVSFVRQVAPQGSLFVEIPEAHHHVMVDQPLAFVAALRAILAAWGHSAARD